jgi:hypothetical protein
VIVVDSCGVASMTSHGEIGAPVHKRLAKRNGRVPSSRAHGLGPWSVTTTQSRIPSMTAGSRDAHWCRNVIPTILTGLRGP